MREHAAAKPRSLISLCSFVSFLVMVFSLPGCTGGEPKHPTWKNATGAEQYERLMWKAIRDKDWKEVEYHLAPAFVGVNAAGQALDRAGWLEYWKTSKIKEFSLGEISVQPGGPDMVVTYVLHLDGAPAEHSNNAGPLRVVSVWQQVKAGWTLTATSVTPVISP
jgi:ketosteroid isomerase-like protein